MRESALKFEGVTVPVFGYNTIVIGTGAAGFNAAERLHAFGQSDVAIVTEGIQMGTSRNTGSDKQTYYKLSLGGGQVDSPALMARDLFAGKCVDGDQALTEAAESARAFLRLCELGVDFPTNRFGEYIGYRTDHDTRARATSVGPLTSKRMTECLEAAVKARGIPIYDGYQVISILKDGDRVTGVLTLFSEGLKEDNSRFAVFMAKNIIWATGGPAGIYRDTVYPRGHTGASGIAFEAGAQGRNLTEWQYGLASVAPRWNVSGTYMQVLPRFVSVDAESVEREFLAEHFLDEGECLSHVFRKGYEWPFDSRKAERGSSIVDLLVYRERVLRGRRVYLDYRFNPHGRDAVDYTLLDADARDYLERAGGCFGTPVERLLHMNAPAYQLYLSKGVDLKREMLEIALCAQHNNGGLDVDIWWRTNLQGLFAVGEAAGTHGVYRPGGSALNAGQVGSYRAAKYIAVHGRGDAPSAKQARASVEMHIRLCQAMLGDEETAGALLDEARGRMSAVGASIRDVEALISLKREVEALLNDFARRVSVTSSMGLLEAYRLRDCLLGQRMYAAAMIDYAHRGGGSRGSALYLSEDGASPKGLGEAFRFHPDDGSRDTQTQLVRMRDGEISGHWREVNPLPDVGGFFENIWREYLNTGGVPE